jgi:hypothetical protein
MCATLFQNESSQMTCEMKTIEVPGREKNSPDDTPEPQPTLFFFLTLSLNLSLAPPSRALYLSRALSFRFRLRHAAFT